MKGSGIRVFHTGEDAQQGGLAASVGSDQRGFFTGVQAEGDIRENGMNTVGFGDGMNSKHMQPLLNKKTGGRSLRRVVKCVSDAAERVYLKSLLKVADYHLYFSCSIVIIITCKVSRQNIGYFARY